MHKIRRTALLASLLGGIALAAAAAPGSATYLYDGLGRLKAVIYEDGTGQSYSYDPAGNRSTSVSGALTTFSISANAPTVSEPGTATFTVTKTGPAAATVNYATADGTAHSPTNYTAASGTLSFTATQTSQTVNVSTVRDSKYDGPLNFSLKLNTPGSGAVITTDGASVTLNDADPAPAFSIAANSAPEGSILNLTVSRANASSVTQTVNYATSDGTAAAGIDYAATSGTLSFAPADGPKTISIPTIHRSLYEGTRNLVTTLSTPSGGAVLGSASASGSISDLDTPISFAIANSSGTVAEGNPITFTVTQGGGQSGIPFTVNYAINSGTAVYGTDITAGTPSTQTGTLSFPVGTTSQTVVVNTMDARLETGTRNFTVSLSGASNAAPIGTASATGTIQETNVPAPPTLSPAGQTNSINGNWSLSWNNPGGNPTSYKLWETTPTYTVINVYTGPNLYASGAGLKNSQSYTFQVQACNANGCGALSNEADVNICYGANC